MINIKLNTSSFDRDIERFIKKNNRDFVRGVTGATNEMHKMAKKKVRQLAKGKIRSGHLTNEIHQKIYNGGFTGEVISHASYSQAFEEGTRPHIIRVKGKKVLAGPARGAPPGWKSVGPDYATYGTVVRHPGTPAHPYMYPAWLWGQRKLEDYIRKALN